MELVVGLLVMLGVEVEVELLTGVYTDEDEDVGMLLVVDEEEVVDEVEEVVVVLLVLLLVDEEVVAV